ncbi:hypothetical protein [Alkaliphilus oremlandii]|uniref:hypothetical protein n=1 Tax=Alkaliphilus oremlandii TaxID=461876 RepID=UPI0018DCD6F2|nr:hypothetical protein [Alkaliphilus oremlandii]
MIVFCSYNSCLFNLNEVCKKTTLQIDLTGKCVFLKIKGGKNYGASSFTTSKRGYEGN